MSKFKRTLAMLIAVVMVICALPMTVAAEETGDKNAIKVSKSYNQGTGELTLEAYVTGETQTVVTTQPIDVVLVLDVSGSMDDPVGEYKPTYDVNRYSFTHYYYKDNTGFHRAYYCGNNSYDCDGGWFTQHHGYYDGHDGEKLVPKTSQNDTTGVQFYVLEVGKQKKIDALRDAAKAFIDLVAGRTDTQNNIAIVKFAGNKNERVGNDKYRDGPYTYNYSQTVKPLMRADQYMQTLKDAVDSLRPAGATRSDYGMQLAQTVLGNKVEGRKQIVIMFTDGEPTDESTFNKNVANSAISAAASLKANGVTVYTIGCFADANASEITTRDQWNGISEFNQYMNLVSSNSNKDARNMTDGFSYYNYNGYYKTAANASELSSVFEQISQDIGSASYELDEKTVLKDIITNDFVLPDGASSVRAYTADFTGKDAEGNMTWGATNALPAGSVTVAGNTIDVTGFDYSENWVGTLNGVARGKKLVVKVKIEVAPDKKLYGVVPTNTNQSGIYVNDELVKEFEVPNAVYPYYVIMHVRDGEITPENVRYNGKSGYPGVSLTDKVAELTDENNNGYLYGGAFSSSDCTTAYNFNSGNGIAYTLREFDDENVEKIYVKEVSDYYLRPKTLSLWATNSNGLKDVVGYYFVAVIDDTNYMQVGFDYNGEGLDNAEFHSDSIQQLGSSNIFNEIKLVNKQGTPTTYLPADFYNGEVTRGFFAVNRVPKASWNDAGDTSTFTPYWITLDGVKVTSIKTRYESYLGAGDGRKYEEIDWIKDETHNSVCTEFETPSTQTLLLSTCFVADGTGFDIPVTPVDPDPGSDGPTIIIPIERNYVVTVHDGDNEYELKVAKNNNGISIEPMGFEDKLFAGWYIDDEPTDLAKITSNVDVYAHYVSDDYLCTKYIEQGLFRVYGMTLISALDSDNYLDAGFIINGDQISCDYSESYGAFTARALFGSGVARRSKLMTHSLSLRNASNGDKYEVTPYWVTLDGMTVYGTSRTFVYNSRGIIG